MLTSGVFGYLLDYVIWWILFLSFLVHVWCFFRFFPKQARTSRLVLGNLFLFFCLLGAAGLAGESYLRFVAVGTDSFGMSLPARRWFALYTHRNSLGCRDKEWSQTKPPGVRRVVFLGDSFTYGWGIENPSDRFADLIQARFDAVQPGTVEVMNVAKPGWGTHDQIQPLMDMVELYGVEEVVLCHVPNDIEKLLHTTDDFNPIRPPTPGLINLESSPLLDYLYRRIYLPRVPTVRGYHDWLAEGYGDPEIWNQQRQDFQQMIDVCRERGVIFRVALLPFLRTQGAKFDQQKIHQELRQFFEANHVPIADLQSALRDKPADELVVNSVDPHPNELAHRLFADRLWGFWQPGRP
jgi:hypothetical protein